MTIYRTDPKPQIPKVERNESKLKPQKPWTPVPKIESSGSCEALQDLDTSQDGVVSFDEFKACCAFSFAFSWLRVHFSS